MNNSNVVKISCLLASLFVLSGCGPQSEFIDLAYPAHDEGLQIERLTSTTLPANGDSKQVWVTIVDQRTRDRIGELGSIAMYTNDNVSIWLHDAIATELGKVGYVVPDISLIATAGTPNELSVTLTEAHFDYFGAATSQIGLIATLSENGTTVRTESFTAKLTSKLVLFSPEDAASENLGRALQMAIIDMLTEFGFIEPLEPVDN